MPGLGLPPLVQRLAARARACVPPDSAENLAVFRITVALVVLTCGELRAAPEVAALAPALRSAPQDLGAWLQHLPMTPSLVRGAAAVVMGAAVLGLIGLWARAAFAVVALVGTYAIGAVQLGGSVWHCHHLIWFSALLATSPCDDALSIKALWAARRLSSPGPPRQHLDPAYGLPIRIAWALLVMIFFFPGLWKLRASGLSWILSDNLRNQMLGKWLQAGGVLPLLRVDRWPRLCQLAAAAVVLLELCFPLLVLGLGRRGRLAALLLALLFHLGTSLFMGFGFSVLWPCYVVLIDWTPLVRGLRGAPAPTTRPGRAGSLGPCALVGGALLLGNGLFGLRGQTQGWPLACYPTFQYRAPATLPVLLLYAVRPDGSVQELPRPWQLGGTHAPRSFALQWSLIGTGRREVDPARLRAYLQHLRSHPAVERSVRGACAVRFFRVQLPVRPEDWAAPVRRQDAVLLYSLPLAGCVASGSR